MTIEAPVQAPPQTIYLTFGVKYRDETHPYWPGATPDGWVEITAVDHTAARRLATRYFGRSWSTTYDSLGFNPDEAKHHYYPLGAIAQISEDGATSLITGVEPPTPRFNSSDPEYYGVDSREVVGVRIEGRLKEDPSEFYDVRLFHRSCAEEGETLFEQITEDDQQVRAFELDWASPALCGVCRRALS